jgi:membrane associated rhomboid family serine protease
MPVCPLCQTPLATVRQREGIYYRCDSCTGRAVTVPQVRRVAGDRFATQMLRQINSATQPSGRFCPFCEGLMKQFTIQDPPLTLDSCKTCAVVWFDPNEFEAVPEGAIEATDQLQIRGREALALEKIKRIERETRRDDAMPDETWKWVAAFVGMPVEMDERGLSRIPWVNWSLCIAIILISVVGFTDLRNAIDRFGLIPAQAFRDGGFTFLSSFFLHAGVWHLISNLYFLFIFGNTVEDYLGRIKFGLLVLFAAMGGDILDMALQPRSHIPSIGASGGISGVIAFYALQFPRARLGFFTRFCWIQIPAWGAFALWILLQIITSFQQMAGLSNVSGLAHLGGAAIGFLLWIWWGNSLKCKA